MSNVHENIKKPKKKSRISHFAKNLCCFITTMPNTKENAQC